MQANSMLSMKIALKMLRKAQNMSYGEILQMEINASLNKTEDIDFELGVTEILMKQPRRGEKPMNPGFDNNISDAQVDAYFVEHPKAHRIKLDIVENSLLPTRHFYEKFTDSLRVYINETVCPQDEVRNAVELEIKDILRVEGIDILDKSITIPLAREMIYKKHEHERYTQEFFRRSV